jgi:NitT/TauT family transport system ATP-binding protein
VTATRVEGESLLRVEGISKSYRSANDEVTVALDPVTFSMASNEFISLVGPSGCGKTTLLKIAAGLVEPTSGTIDYRSTGRPVVPGTFGMVFQGPALLPWRTVLDNVLLPATILRLDRTRSRERAHALLELVHLDGQEGKYPAELSGGMRQRVAIARALMHDPDLLFMDEPFGALDAMTREELNMSLQEVHLAQRKSVLFVTHSISEAVLLADRVVVMSARPGRIVDIVPITLERPRSMHQISDPAFHEAEVRIRDHLGIA